MGLPAHPVLGWSHRRHRLYSECPRKYWIAVHLAWQGWAAKQGTPSHLAYRLTKLVTWPQLVGQIVHEALREVAEAVMAGRDLPEWDDLYQPAWETLRRVRATTREEFIGDPRAHRMLFDAYYRVRLNREINDDLRDAGDCVYECLVNALEMDQLWEELSTAARALAPDKLRENEVTVLGEPEAIPWWGAPDLVYMTADRDAVHIIDYKTGERTDLKAARAQIHSYAAFMVAGGARWDPRWRGRVVRLREAREDVFRITREGLHAAFRAVEDDVRRWRMHQRTPEDNVVRMEDFPPTEDRARCAHCPFVEVCQMTRDPEGQGGAPT